MKNGQLYNEDSKLNFRMFTYLDGEEYGIYECDVYKVLYRIAKSNIRKYANSNHKFTFNIIKL